VPALMTPDEYYAQLLVEIALLREVLSDGDLSAPVVGCPGWDVAALGAHVGGIYRFATTGLTDHRGSHEPIGPRPRPELLDWFDSGAASVVSALTSASWDSACWTFGPPATHAFWARRMCHETMLHRWDAQASQRAAGPITGDWAADGVAEIVTMFFPRQVRVGRMPPLEHTVELNLVDVEGSALRIGGDGITAAEPVAIITGTAADVLLLLWKRAGIDELPVSIEGAADAARLMLGAALTP
jgi:uncharacterized protein (TIGR03083 family)